MRDVRLTCQPGAADKPNEDCVVAVPGLLAVLDGVTVPEGLDTGCRHGPAWYVRQLAARLAAGHLAAPDTALDELVAHAIEAVRDAHGGQCDLGHPASPQSTLAMLRSGADGCDYLLLADSALVLDDGRSVRVLTDLRSHDVGRQLGHSAPSGASRIGSAEHAKRIRDRAAERQKYINQPGGYWVASTDPAAARHAVRGHIRTGSVDFPRRAALLTDGASCVVDQYRLTDWRGLLNLIEAYGAAHVVELARATERADPHGQAQPRPKTHDDATVAYCRLD